MIAAVESYDVLFILAIVLFVVGAIAALVERGKPFALALVAAGLASFSWAVYALLT